MKTINALVERIYNDAKTKIIQKQKQDKAAYKDLIKNLIV